MNAKTEAVASLALRDQILGADDRPREAVACPEWGATVFIRTMSGLERDAFEIEQLTLRESDPGNKRANLSNFKARLCVRCAVDENGEPIFKPGDAAALGAKSSKVLARLYDAASRLNGLADEDVEALAGN